MPMPDQTITFVGGGNMAAALIGGLVHRRFPVQNIRVVEPRQEARQQLAERFGVGVFERANDAAAGADCVVLAVKPQVMREVCCSLRDSMGGALAVSIAAGITTAQLSAWLGSDRLVRSMPNTPALLGAGATGMFASAAVTAAQRALAESLMAAVGLVCWIDDERLMDSVTATSGSGPAYVFLLAEAMQHAAESQGLPQDTARALVNRTLLGAARMLEESGQTAEQLRRQVTSPGGTTAAALDAFAAGGFEPLVAAALEAARARGAQLSASND